MVLMADAADNDHDRRHTGSANPPSDSPAPAPSLLPVNRTPLHGFSFPTLSWGTHRLLRCSKNPDLLPPPPSPDTPSPDKEKARRFKGGSGEGEGEGGDGNGGGSPQHPPQRPWNLRTRRSATAAPRAVGWNDAAEAAPEPSPAFPTETTKQGFSIALSKLEIAEDFAAIRATRPPRRPKKRPRVVQKQLDLLYPGLCLADVTPDSYKVVELRR